MIDRVRARESNAEAHDRERERVGGCPSCAKGLVNGFDVSAGAGFGCLCLFRLECVVAQRGVSYRNSTTGDDDDVIWIFGFLAFCLLVMELGFCCIGLRVEREP